MTHGNDEKQFASRASLAPRVPFPTDSSPRRSEGPSGRQLSAGVFWFRRTSLLPSGEPSSAGWEPPSTWPHTGVSAIR